MDMRRREFIGFAAAGLAGCATAETPTAGGKAVIDPNLSVVISDVHIPQPWSEQKYRTGREYPWIIDSVKSFVAEIAAMNPLPSHVFCLGDVSLAFSEDREYEIAARLLQPLEDAGIKIVMTVGNHDLRAPFYRFFPRWLGVSPVKGRICSVTSLPHCDIVLLDSLVEPPPEKRGKYNALTQCGLGKEQTAWALDYAKNAARPTIFAAHHTAKSIGLERCFATAPNVFGYLHGHNHAWQNTYLRDGYATDRMVRSLGVGSFGIDRDIGYLTLRFKPNGVIATQIAKDYFFPEMPKDGSRHPLWRDIVRDNNGRVVHFPFAK